MKFSKDQINVINVSGGKDSTATLLLAKERLDPDKMIAVFSDVGNESPITLDYIEYLNEKVFPIKKIKADFSEKFEKRRERIKKQWAEEGINEEHIKKACELLYPTGNPFLDVSKLHGFFPTGTRKFCTIDLKVKPVTEQIIKPLLDEYDEVLQWLGIRWDESQNRANAVELEEDKKLDGLTYYRPILSWTAEDTFALHKKHGIKPNPLYKMGMKRVGCMPCIYSGKEEIFQIFKRFPEEFERIKEWEKIVEQCSKINMASFFERIKTTGTGYGIDEVIKWSKTARGGKQLTLRSTKPVKQCLSHYGLCE